MEYSPKGACDKDADSQRTYVRLKIGLLPFCFFFYLLQQKPFKNDENDFDFVLKAPFVLKTAWLEIYG